MKYENGMIVTPIIPLIGMILQEKEKDSLYRYVDGIQLGLGLGLGLGSSIQ